MKKKLRTESFFKLSRNSEKIFTEYMIKYVASMYGDDPQLNLNMANSLGITLNSFNKMVHRYKANPKLKEKFWSTYDENLHDDITYKKEMQW